MRKILKWIIISLAVIFIIIQFFRPEKNNSGNTSNDISVKYPLPASVKAILETSCNDCHSNKTKYPWYAQIQPVTWWLNDHIVEGKSDFNLNEFSSYPIYRQYHKLEELIELVEEEEMPLSSYTIIHRDAKLSDGQKSELISWAKGLRDRIKADYPADSLVRPKKRN